MQAHGEFQVKLIKQVVHTYPEGGFNKEGIKAVHHAILESVQNTAKWALFEHPKDEAGITPDAVEEMLFFYHRIEHQGCQFICVDLNHLSAVMFKNMVQKHLTIPTLINPLETEFKQIWQQFLA